NGLDLDLRCTFPADGSHGCLLCGGGRPRNLAGFEQLLEMPEILADGLRGFATDERRHEHSGLACRWRVLQVHADLCAPAAACRVKVHGSRCHDVRSRKRSPREYLVLDLVNDLR